MAPNKGPHQRERPHRATREEPLNLAVEDESTVYTGMCPRNGSSPMWCYGNTCIVRIDGNVFVSGQEKLEQFEPPNDCRWTLYQQTADGWELRQADERGRTREPCPLATLPGKRLFLSNNPTLLGAGASGSGPARPEILAFDANNPLAAARALLPEWEGRPGFNEHSYRSFAADAEGDELVLFQNVSYTHAEWALFGHDSVWHSGRLAWPPYEDTRMTPYGASLARVNYPVVVLRDRAVHFCGAAAFDTWSRVSTPELAGRKFGNRFRRLYYTWTDDITEVGFHDWIEIDNTFDDGGWVFAADLHLDPEGVLHLLWYRAPINRRFRDEHFPDIVRRYAVCYARLHRGKVLHREVLVEAGEGISGEIPTEIDTEDSVLGWKIKGQEVVEDPISTPRFQATPDGRLFVIYYVSGSAPDGTAISENRFLEINADGRASDPIGIPLKHPLTEFFTATPRAGSKPSFTIDLLGYRRGGFGLFTDTPTTLSYARVRVGDSSASRDH